VTSFGNNPLADILGPLPGQPQPQSEEQPQAESGTKDLGPPGGDVSGVVTSYLAGGLEGLPGIFGDTRDFGYNVGELLRRNVRDWAGEEPETPEQTAERQKARESNLLSWIPTSEETKKFFGHKQYEPTTPAGKAVDKAGSIIEAVPSVLLGGGTQVLKKLGEEGVGAAAKTAIKHQVKYNVVPQEVTQHVVDPIAELAGVSPEARQVLDAFAMAGIAGVAGLREKPSYGRIPSAEDIQSAATARMDQLRRSGFSIPRSSLQDLVDEMSDHFNQRGVFNQRRQPQAWSLLHDMWDASRRRGPMDYFEAEAFRAQAEEALGRAAGRNDLEALSSLHKGIDNWINNPNQLQGVPARMVKEYQDALKLAKLSRAVDAVQQAMENVANDVHGREGSAKVLQKNFARLLNDPRTARLFSPEEQDMIREVVQAKEGSLSSVMEKLSHWASPIGIGIGLVDHGIGNFWQTAMEGAGAQTLATVASRLMGGKGPKHVAENVSARMRSQYKPGTGGTGPARKIPLRPGLKPALVASGMYAAGTIGDPSQGQVYKSQNPLADILGPLPGH
jgi:hypothetical protein